MKVQPLQSHHTQRMLMSKQLKPYYATVFHVKRKCSTLGQHEAAQRER